jgi:predicted 2-oxoglutarate/Fe(II)-dependent dioxygenase YbiX
VPARRPAAIAGFLSPAECLDVIAEIEARPHIPAGVLNETTQKRSVDADAWHSAEVELSAGTRQHLERRLSSVLPRLARRFDCEVTELSGVGAFVYGPGGHFATHKDTGEDPRGNTARRKVSIVVTLNDGGNDFDGGELRLYVPPDRMARVRSRPGQLIAFPVTTPHRVTPVIRGKRYSLVAWALAGR